MKAFSGGRNESSALFAIGNLGSRVFSDQRF